MNTPDIERQTTPVSLSAESQQSPHRIFFGGSFDPPHIGHAMLPAQICETFESARVIYVPAGRSPFKVKKPTADHHRSKMLELATQHTTNTEIWTQELVDSHLNPQQPSFWADTWLMVQRMNLPGTNRFLIGADQAISMHRWRRFSEFWKDAIVVLRDDVDSSDALAQQLKALHVWSASELAHWQSRVVKLPTIDASSTAIRHSLSNTDLREKPITGLDPDVHRYILEHHLYVSTP